MMSTQNMQFYRRQLPQSCIDFSSKEGKELFIGALNEGNANIYFKLAAQFRTQEEPAFCGLSTLVMVLNALEVDPGRVWKGAWRWYHESMLECCQSLEIIEKNGINLAEFTCTARCNRLEVTTIYANDTNESFAKFRQCLKDSVKSEDTVLVASYNRKILGQTGSGHFSPISAYNSSQDSLLIMDVARFKYPPHWVKVELLWEAMKSIDPETGKARGYCIMRLRPTVPPLLTFRLSQAFVDKKAEIWTKVSEWRQWLKLDLEPNVSDDVLLSETLAKAIELFRDYAICCLNCKECLCEDKELHETTAQLCSRICFQIQSTDIYKRMMALIERDKHYRKCCTQKPTALVALVLSWPFDLEKTKRSTKICSMIIGNWEHLGTETTVELNQLRDQLELWLG